MIARLAFLVTALVAVALAQYNYSANWPSINSRPLPDWYDEAKFGIFIHWGVFSVPAFGSEWFWYSWETQTPEYVAFVNDNYPPGWTYQDFASQFTAELWDPNAWATLFQQSGAKYIVLTSKHHEGFTNWPSNTSWGWDSVTNGPHRDLVGELTTAIRAQNLTMGLYHSMFEWYNPLFLADQSNNFQTNNFVVDKTLPELYDIVNKYQPDVIWSDGDWDANSSYWQSTEFLAWLYNESPVRDTVVVNDRWGSGCPCANGGYFTCTDRYNPGTLQNHKWENAMTIDADSWGYNRLAPISEYLTINELISSLVSTVACGGNLLLNVGPNHDGTIDPIFQERLLQIGSWLQINGQAIYATKPWRAQNESDVNLWYTMSSNASIVYAMILQWPANSILHVNIPIFTSGVSVVEFLGYSGQLQWTVNVNGGVDITLPSFTPLNIPSTVAWTIVLHGVK